MYRLLVILLTLLSGVASADSHGDERFSISLGVFVTDRDTDTRLDATGTTDTGTDINFEKDLALDSSDTVFRLDGYFRFAEKHRIDFSVFDLSRDASTPINRDIQFGDTQFTIDTTVDTNADLSIYKAAYTYSFMQRDKGYLGATAGLYVADAKVTLSESTLGQSAVGDVTAPLPVIGLRGQYELADRWTFRASGEFFFIEYEDIDGSLVDLYAGVDYRVLDNLSVGLAFNSVTIDVDSANDDFLGALNWRYTGGLLFLKFDF